MRILLSLIVSLPIYYALAEADLYIYYIPLLILQILGGLDHKLSN